MRSGGLTIKTNDLKIVELKIDENEIAIDLQNLDTVKDLVKPLRKTSSKSEEKEKQSILEILKSVKDFSKELKTQKMTINIKETGDSILVLGEKAKPRLSRLVLGSHIQANILKIISILGKIR
jgi:HEAT repeat protein